MTIDINTILAAALSQAIAEQLAPLEQRIAAQASLITALKTQLDERSEAIDNSALDERIKAIAESVLDAHKEEYNHDNYDEVVEEFDRHLREYDHDEFITDIGEAVEDSTLIKRAVKAALSEHEEEYNHDAFVSDISEALGEIHVEEFINVERLLARTELTATINFQTDLDELD